MEERALLENITKVPSNASSDIGAMDCQICYETIDTNEDWFAILDQCTHPEELYHHDCIEQWFQIKKVCPTCFKEMRWQDIFTNKPASRSSSSHENITRSVADRRRQNKVIWVIFCLLFIVITFMILKILKDIS